MGRFRLMILEDEIDLSYDDTRHIRYPSDSYLDDEDKLKSLSGPVVEKTIENIQIKEERAI